MLLGDECIITLGKSRGPETAVELFEELQQAIVNYQVRIIENRPSSRVYACWTVVKTKI